MSFRRTISPASEPITLAEAKDHLRVTNALNDTIITTQIVAAREYAEEHCSRAFIEQTFELYLDAFPGEEIMLPRPPLLSVTTVQYLDTAGVQQTLPPADYKVDAISEPAELVAAYGKSWPAGRVERNAVVITYKAGYGTVAAAVPQPIKQAMLLLIGEMYERREEAIVGASVTPNVLSARALLMPYRIVQI